MDYLLASQQNLAGYRNALNPTEANRTELSHPVNYAPVKM